MHCDIMAFNMSNFAKQQEEKKEGKDKVRREKLAGFFFNLAQLVFAGLVVGGLSPLFEGEFLYSVNEWGVIIAGLFFTGCLAGFANRILK